METDRQNPVWISVIMPAYNSAAYIRQAIQSVYDQTIQEPLELIVIDNGSSDETLSLIREEKRRWEQSGRADRVLCLLHNELPGVSKTRNMGMQYAKGKYLAFLDSDDLWDREKLEKQMHLFEEHPACRLVCSGRELIRADGTATGRVIPVPEKIDYTMLLRGNQINCSSVVIEKELALRYPMEHDDSHEDYIMWLRILKEGGYATAVNEPLLKTRLSAGGKSRNKIRSAYMTWKVYRYVGLSIPETCFYFLHYMIAGFRKYYG